uniref:MAT1-1-1 n=1 Tax=Aspergillus heterothallicus TaxID=41742 RepID=A0A3G6VE11_9EURO|nr:MAT1-1-1 [Aspergillus heterothallicus]
MENELSPLQRAFNLFLLSMPPDQLDELVKYIQVGKAQEISSPVHDWDIPAARLDTAQDNQHTVVLPDSAVTRPSSSRGKRSHDGRRPLNWFIAFRSYYSVIFPDLTQKAKSGILRFLWQADPFKAKWAILAKAYSIIRDKHDDEVSLESFLTLNAPLIGILDPDRYLNVIGWQLAPDDQQQYTMARVKTPASLEAESSTNYSVDDLVKHCYATGYVTIGKGKSKAIKHHNAPTMAFAVQPALVIHKDDSLQVSGNNTIVSTIYSAEVDMEYPSFEPTEDTLLPNPSDLSSNVANDTTLGAMENIFVCHRQQPSNDPGAGNDFMPDNIGFPGIINASPQALMPYDPLYCDPFEAFDIKQFLDV